MVNKEYNILTILASTIGVIVITVFLFACVVVSTYGAELEDTSDEEPWNTMSEDFGDELDGFMYYEISEDCQKAGGELPLIAQEYLYCICKQYDVDYEMVFALIEHESKCKWDVKGDHGKTYGLMQIMKKYQKDRMEELNVDDLLEPYSNMVVGVDIIAELQEKYSDEYDEETLPYVVLAAYNYGCHGAEKHLFSKGKYKYSYNEAIMDRAYELKEYKEETMNTQEVEDEELGQSTNQN